MDLEKVKEEYVHLSGQRWPSWFLHPQKLAGCPINNERLGETLTRRRKMQLTPIPCEGSQHPLRPPLRGTPTPTPSWNNSPLSHHHRYRTEEFDHLPHRRSARVLSQVPLARQSTSYHLHLFLRMASMAAQILPWHLLTGVCLDDQPALSCRYRLG